MEEKIVIEAYKEVLEEDLLVPKVEDVRNRIIYNLDAKAYNLIYELSESDVKTEEIIKVLCRNKLSYYYKLKLYNSCQTKII